MLALVGTAITSVGAAVVAVVRWEGAWSVWRTYLTDWTRWNHLRTAGALAAMTIYILRFRAR